MRWATTLCELRRSFATDTVVHLTMSFPRLYNERENFWNLVTDVLPVEISASLHAKSDVELTDILLGAKSELQQMEELYVEFVIIVSSYIGKIAKMCCSYENVEASCPPSSASSAGDAGGGGG